MLDNTPAVTAPREHTQKRPAPLEKIPAISVVDDDPSVRSAIDDLLKSSGYSTKVFGTADVFLSSSSIWDSDCIVSDMEMPGTSGVELIRLLRLRGIDTPVVLMSARAGVSTAVEATAYGAFAFVEKPFLPERFLDVVHSASRRGSRSQRMLGARG
ncbi:response regulator transcription factor [Agrobacterium tumefaciens]|uniref:response regulator transcription factor n=1 Tax=Agrobacterium tumefaciens TaxID=358 RepID=UPI00384E2126